MVRWTEAGQQNIGREAGKLSGRTFYTENIAYILLHMLDLPYVEKNSCDDLVANNIHIRVYMLYVYAFAGNVEMGNGDDGADEKHGHCNGWFLIWDASSCLYSAYYDGPGVFIHIYKI